MTGSQRIQARTAPKALDDIVMDCLKKKPADRPRTAKELMMKLDGCLPSPDAWTPETARDRWDTHLPREEERGEAFLELKTATMFVPAVS